MSEKYYPQTVEATEEYLEHLAKDYKGFQYKVVTHNHMSGCVAFKTQLIQADVLNELVHCDIVQVWYYRGKWLICVRDIKNLAEKAQAERAICPKCSDYLYAPTCRNRKVKRDE